jgi:uncharacterized protein YndB with AHSA1/START domain
MCPGNVKSAEAQLDVRVGGRFRILMKDGEREFDHRGEYLVVERPSKLVFTWTSKGTDNRATLVTVELVAAGDQCDLTLTHDKLPTLEARDKHENGWTDIVRRLAEHLESRGASEPRSDFSMKLTYAAPASKLYEQFSTQEGIRNWWTRTCELEERVGGVGSFQFPKAGFYATVRIDRLEPGRCVEWICTDSKHPESSGFDNLRDWIGTRLRFEVEPIGGDKSRLVFTHAGLAPLECFGVCSNSWSYYLNDSLRDYLEQGGGKPYKDPEG